MSERQRGGLWAVMSGVMAAMFGVRSSKGRERDFTAGRPAAYVIVGLILTVIFVVTIVGVVVLVMHLSGV